MKNFILFDNDGVLVETENLYYEANIKALNDLGFDLNLNSYMEVMKKGGSVWQIIEKEGISERIMLKQRDKRDLYYQELLSTRNIEIAGVKDVLTKLSKDYKMGIVTTSKRDDFELIHKNRGIVDFMEFTLCVEDYPRAKPYADPYLAGLKKFNGGKEETIIIEDSQRGLDSAYNAGIECVIVKNEFTKSHHDFSKANYYIDSLNELPSLLSKL